MVSHTENPLRLGVVFGSRSVEHEVSIITATQMIRSVDRSKYSVVPLYIDKRGRWWTGESLARIETYQNLDLHDPQFEEAEAVEFSPDPTKDHGIDVAIFCVHGGYGEDGTLAGLFELANVAYAAPGVVGAAVAIDKLITKLALPAAGFPVTNFVWFTTEDWKRSSQEVVEKIEKKLQYSLFVKPATLGSSVGVTKVTARQELKEAIELALNFDDRIIVEEEARDCIEVNVSVLGSADTASASQTEQPIKTEAFLTYADKYERGGKKTKGMASLSRRIPAPISQELNTRIQEAAKGIWKVIHGSGVARIDFFANPSTEKFFVGEVNCPPGSMAFYLWEASGVSYTQMIDRLVEAALERHGKQQKMLHSIGSNILKQQKGE